MRLPQYVIHQGIQYDVINLTQLRAAKASIQRALNHARRAELDMALTRDIVALNFALASQVQEQVRLRRIIVQQRRDFADLARQFKLSQAELLAAVDEATEPTDAEAEAASLL